ncbi:ATP-binding cassette domain-containing protein [Bacteriovoracaceae bacterium]|nr:ATP-binding cassette domain-containing protein [Bacteriovoracaceae bacterium]|tara:strand:- start:79405 stop:80421 length:1017 start_codon:yes stop_codon:yes gene_type:complete
MEQAHVINVNQLCKKFVSYKKEPGVLGSVKSFFVRNAIEKKAVDNFQMTVKKGEIIGLLGPNGAGKTTLMKMFTGIVVPTSGELTILGHNPWERDKGFRKKIALVMGQKSQLWWDIPAMDSFTLLQRYYEIPDDRFKERIDHMSEILEVKDLLHIHVRKLSLGERMKLELMASLLHDPEVIFLDEPTIGLDLIAQENIRNFIKEYHRKTKCTIIITSHYMADVQALCDRLVLIMGGTKGFDGPIYEFEKVLGNEKTLSFSFSSEQDPSASIWESYDPEWDEKFRSVELRVPEEELRELSSQIIKNLDVIDFATEKLPIERVMKTLMEKPELLQTGQHD